MPQLAVGDAAPDFTLPTADGGKVVLSALRGTSVVIFFFPAAMTPGCTLEAVDFRDLQPDLRDAGYEVLGVSPDPVAKLAAEIPGEAKIEVVRDASKFIRDSVEDVESTLLLGGLLTILIVFFFLNSWQSTVITGLTLPDDGWYIVSLPASSTVGYLLVVQRRQNLLVEGLSARPITTLTSKPTT